MKKIVISMAVILLLTACNSKKKDFDSTGTFESDEVIVSAQQTGQLLSFTIHEGDKLQKNQLVGVIDVSNVELQKERVRASIGALKEKLNTPRPQIEVTEKQLALEQSQLNYWLREKARTEKLLKADAATQKQLDDINNKVDGANRQIEVLKQQIASFSSTIDIQNRTIMSETNPLEKTVNEIDDQIRKGKITNPISGIVLTQYAFEGEMAGIGKALYKIANVDTLTLRAYITGNQLPIIKLGQKVKVQTDDGKGGFKETEGTIKWISENAEFTPKTIQTKDERADMVYAIKVQVKNDGSYKIGMYGEVKF